MSGIPKNVVQRYFFHFRIPLRYSDIERLSNVIKTPTYDVQTFPKRYSAPTLIRIKRALEDCRRNEGTMTKAAVDAEMNLLEAASEMGDSTAIALLCGARMRQPDVSEEDMQSGSDSLRQLMDANFPLAFKVSGDLAFAMGRPRESEQFYLKALEAGLTDNRLEVECWRNLGHFAFQQSRLATARMWFSKACESAEDPKQVLDCHFLSAQLREPDRLAVRQHLEAAANFGFQDAFVPLGSLLSNWFGEPILAREWFKLASSTDKTGYALIGLLDAAVKLEDWELGESTIARMQGLGERGENLLAQRKESVDLIKAKAPKGTTIDTVVNERRQKPSGRFDI